jgi:4-hydroxymandelate synthase
MNSSRLTTASTRDALAVDHVRFAVTDAAARAADLVDGYGFEVVGAGGPEHDDLTIALAQGDILFVLTEGRSDAHPASTYVALHGEGVCDIALRTPDTRAAFARAVANGARVVAEPVEQSGGVSATIAAFGDVTHTFVTPPPDTAHHLAGLGQLAVPTTPGPAGLGHIDHLAVCVPAGELDSVTGFYEAALGLRIVFTERIALGGQAMNSAVVQAVTGGLTLTLLEPDPAASAGQIDDFLKDHGGPGVQHVALSTDDIVRSVSALSGRGVDFLDTPGGYYDLLAERLTPSRHTVDQLRAHGILVDEDEFGQLFQIFARSTHPRRTFFFEVIQRLRARTFGSGNIRALYAAVEFARTGTRPTA